MSGAGKASPIKISGLNALWNKGAPQYPRR